MRILIDDHPESRDYLTEAFQEEELEEHKRKLAAMLPIVVEKSGEGVVGGVLEAAEAAFGLSSFVLAGATALAGATLEGLDYQREQLQEEDADYNKSMIEQLEEISQRNSQVDHFQKDQMSLENLFIRITCMMFLKNTFSMISLSSIRNRPQIL